MAFQTTSDTMERHRLTVTAFVGHTFGATGTASTYDDFVIDDVNQTNPA